MEESNCPNGCGRLERLQTPKGMMWQCTSCQGRSIGVAVLKKSVEPRVVSSLWGMARDGESVRGHPCMHCHQRMARVAMPYGAQDPSAAQLPPGVTVPTSAAQGVVAEPVVEIDICQRCHILWLDRHEIDHLPKPPPVEEVDNQELSPELKKMLAIQLANQAARRVDASLNESEGHVMSMPWRSQVADSILGVVFGDF